MDYELNNLISNIISLSFGIFVGIFVGLWGINNNEKNEFIDCLERVTYNKLIIPTTSLQCIHYFIGKKKKMRNDPKFHEDLHKLLENNEK